jgi:hypothetical protein
MNQQAMSRALWIPQCLALAAAFCLFNGYLWAVGTNESSSLAVVVKDTSGSIVPGASVKLEPGELEIFTDEKGTSNFAELSAGNYSLRVSAPGFKEHNLPDIHVLLGVENSLEVVLNLAGFEHMVTVTATGTKKKLDEAPVRTELIPRDTIQLTAARTLADAVEFTTGLRV